VIQISSTCSDSILGQSTYFEDIMSNLVCESKLDCAIFMKDSAVDIVAATSTGRGEESELYYDLASEGEEDYVVTKEDNRSVGQNDEIIIDIMDIYNDENNNNNQDDARFLDNDTTDIRFPFTLEK